MIKKLKYLMVGIAVIALSGCDAPTNNNEVSAAEGSSGLSVIAGSELKDIEPMLANIKENTGVDLKIEYTGTLDGAEAIMSQEKHYDMAWFSHAKYLSLLQADKKLIQGQEKIAISPVIPAVKEGLAKKWGWVNNANIGWADIAAKVKSGEFKYAMTDPTASNSGFSTVMSVQAAFSKKGDAITAQDVDADKLKVFFSGQALTAGSTGFLSQAFLNEQAKLDGIFSYESELLKLNRNPELKEKLVLIYPKEGTVIADYPLILLDKTKQADYQKVVDYLKSAAFQQWMMDNTDRRPVSTEVSTSGQFSNGLLMDMPFPSNIETVNEILLSYLNDNRKPSHSYFVLDESGSMRGQRIDNLKQAMKNLTGDDTSITGKFAKFRNREKITVVTFDSDVLEVTNYAISNDGQDLQKLRSYTDAMEVHGGTAIYTAMKMAYDLAAKDRIAEPNRFYSIVLMTDGENVNGITSADFKSYFRQNYDFTSGIPTFPIIFGEASSQEMKDLATMTGGKDFDSRKSSLAQVFKQIRGYQ